VGRDVILLVQRAAGSELDVKRSFGVELSGSETEISSEVK